MDRNNRRVMMTNDQECFIAFDCMAAEDFGKAKGVATNIL